MKLEHLTLIGASLLAAAGQILFKLGAHGRSTLTEFINFTLIGGLLCYGLGTLGWVFALSRLPLRVVYPYTALTFVLVYAGALLFLGEKLQLRSLLGVGAVLFGLFLLTSETTS